LICCTDEEKEDNSGVYTIEDFKWNAFGRSIKNFNGNVADK